MIVSEQLEAELATFDANRESLLGTAINKYVLVKGTEIIGTYDTERDAVNEGYRRFGNVPFLVKHVLPTDRPLNFFSGLNI